MARGRPGAIDRRVPAEERRARRAAVADPAVVMEAAAAFLAVRPRTVDETRRRLRRLGYRAELGEAVVARLVELGYLDDAAFARAWVEARDRARPRGEVALRRELRARGVPAESITAALAARRDATPADADRDGTADERAARRLVDRRRASLLREPDPRRRRARVYALLARHGFDPDLCRQVAAAWVPTEDVPV